MRILQVNTKDKGGGAEGSAWNLFRYYSQKGHDSWLAVGSKTTDDPNVYQIPNLEYQSMWTRTWYGWGIKGKNLIGRSRVNRTLEKVFQTLGDPRRIIERQLGIEDYHFPGTWRLPELTPKRAQIIHCHNLHGGYFDLRILPSLSQKFPVILNLRDAWLLSGHCAHSFDCDRWKIGCGHCPYLDTYPSVRRDATAFNWNRKRDTYKRSCLYITAPSHWLMNKVHSSILKGVDYRIIPNGIDLAVFQPGNRLRARRALNLPSDSMIVLLITHSLFKEHDAIEEALANLNIVGKKLLFLCVGRSGNEKEVGRGQMLFQGFESSQERMALYYQASNVFVHVSRDEAFGKTIAEAKACGTPVVATNTSGITEQIDDGRTGILVPYGDTWHLTRAIEQVLLDPDLGSSIGESASADAAKNFGLDTQGNAFLAWYEEVLEDFYNRQQIH